jgi:hypothetical protein
MLTDLINAGKFINDNNKFLTNVLCELLSASLAKSTWDKYCSGWRAWLDFEMWQNFCIQWPLDMCTVRKFVIWCLAHRNISYATAKSYLYSVSIAHSLKGFDCVDYHNDKTLKLILSGAKNAQVHNVSTSQYRRIANFSTLKLISHALASTNWCELSKQVVWTCCTTAFFTSVRMGEILSDYTSCVDSTSTLLWKHVKFLSDDEILIFLPCTKTKKI